MKLAVFSGTSEGHALCRFLSARGARADVYVATEYGAAVMEPMDGVTVHEGRLDTAEIAARLDADTLLVDATHPYAAAVTDNLRAACAETGAQYERLLRPATESDGCETVPDTAAAVAWLNAHPGKALLTTGSKELEAYTAVENWRERLYPRVLSTASVLQKCEALGFPGAHIIAMQGPFSHEMNAALLRQTGADILVTKDTGASGGFAEKLSAAREVGATVLVIARPRVETGRTLEEMQAYLADKLGLAEPDQAQEGNLPRFPLFVSLAGKKCVVVGAGKIAARRIGVLKRFGAEVAVIAPEDKAGVGLTHCRGYEKSDLSGAFLAVAATNDRAVNHRIAQDCAARGIPCSVADCAAEIIRRYEPDLTMLHPANVDGARHGSGVYSEAVEQAVKETDDMIGIVCRAAEATGKPFNFILVSDHGQLNTTRIVNVNTLFADLGWIDADKSGKVTDWRAWSISTGLSSYVILRDAKDEGFRAEVERRLLPRPGLLCDGRRGVHFGGGLLKDQGAGGGLLPAGPAGAAGGPLPGGVPGQGPARRGAGVPGPGAAER